MTDLTGVLREIAEVAGVETAQRLAELRGGGRLSIPSQIKPDSWLALAIGEDKARLLSAHYAVGFTSAEIEVPLGPRGTHARIIAAVRRLLGEGMPMEQIARRLGVSSRMVRRHKAAMVKEAKSQEPPALEGPKTAPPSARVGGKSEGL
jgi:hypothetical protein